ncbi:hypothetical protein KKF34_12585 [Myxococcota bacterium]|nr:hypothetical protein [Myxococcota bacterium]MBU1381464.1 hypothetical protein [Myxococcota bacterium]MBU1497702.1 hypothetical protein [Myxococcota bacterium]
MKNLYLFLTLTIILSSCTKKPKAYTTPVVTQEIRNELDKIKELRREGHLDKAAKSVIKLATKINSEYPAATMYREDVIKALGLFSRISRLCQDKELEIKSESINPDEAKQYSKFYETIESLSSEIKTKLGGIKWLSPPKKPAPPKVEKPADPPPATGDKPEEAKNPSTKTEESKKPVNKTGETKKLDKKKK